MIKEVLPPSLKQDENITKLVNVFDASFAKSDEAVRNVLIYSRIDELPEEVLDLLAWQFHIEGWEIANTDEEKRSLIKSAIELHRYKGTKWAIEKVLELLFLSGKVEEWFEYQGEPYRFKVEVTLDRELNTETIQKLYNLIDQYKNVRSWLDDLICSFVEKHKCGYQQAGIGENWGEALMRAAFELLSVSSGLYQNSAMAENWAEGAMQKEFMYIAEGDLLYQSSAMAEAIAYA